MRDAIRKSIHFSKITTTERCAMRRLLVVLTMAAVAGACTSQSTRTPTQPETISLPLRVEAPAASGQSAKGETPENHRAHLSGDQEVFTPATPGGPTPADSQAQ